MTVTKQHVAKGERFCVIVVPGLLEKNDLKSLWFSCRRSIPLYLEHHVVNQGVLMTL